MPRRASNPALRCQTPAPSDAGGFARGQGERGFAILVVIGTVGMLALAAALFSRVTNAQVRASAVAVETARARALAGAGINLAVLKLLDFRANPNGKNRGFAIGGDTFGCRLDGNLIAAEAHDEGGKIDLNFAGERLLGALLRGLGVDGARTEALVDTILDFRDGDNVKRAKGAEDAEYRAAGRPQGPKNAPFAAVEELNQVLGLDAELYARLSPFVTAHSGKDGIDPTVAQRQLIEILRRGDAPIAPSETGLELSLENHDSDLPTHYLASSTRNIFSIRSEVVMAGGVRFALEAIVDIAQMRPGGTAAAARQAPVYHLWRWHQVPSVAPDGGPAAADPTVPECELVPAT
jgi:general secretion pathway protein K